MSTTEMQVFQNEQFGEVRTVMQDGEPWFVAVDLCRPLDIRDTNKATSRLDEDEKGTNSIRTPGGKQTMTIVNEAGMYTLILGSRKPEAHAFKRWITHEVLPSIRKTGAYVAPSLARDPDVIDTLITALRHEQERVAGLEKQVNYLKSPVGYALRKRAAETGESDDLPERATALFLQTLAALTGEGGRLRDLREAGKPADESELIGYEDERMYYLMPAKTYNLVAKRCATAGSPFPVTDKALYKFLRAAGAIEPAADGSTNTRNKLIDKKTTRLLWVPKIKVRQIADIIGKRQQE